MNYFFRTLYKAVNDFQAVSSILERLYNVFRVEHILLLCERLQKF